MHLSQIGKAAAIGAVIFGQGLGIAQAETPAPRVLAESVQGVPAVIRAKEGGVLAEAVSDAEGALMFRGLEAGSYVLQVAAGQPQAIEVPRGRSGILVIVTGKRHAYVGHVTLLR